MRNDVTDEVRAIDERRRRSRFWDVTTNALLAAVLLFWAIAITGGFARLVSGIARWGWDVTGRLFGMN